MGLAFGLGLGLLVNWGAVARIPQIVASLCAGTASVMLLVTALTFKANFTKLVYLVGFPVIALGFLIMATANEMVTIGLAMMAVGSCYLFMVFICLFIYLERVLEESIVQIVCLGLLFLNSGQVIGGWIGATIVLNDMLADTISTIVVPAGAFLLIVSLYLSNSSRIEDGWGSIKPGSLGYENRNLFDAVSVLAAERGLTKRESDVLLLAAQGRTKKRISQELFISEETAKTHLRRIYQKCEIRTQQELIDIVQERAR